MQNRSITLVVVGLVLIVAGLALWLLNGQGDESLAGGVVTHGAQDRPEVEALPEGVGSGEVVPIAPLRATPVAPAELDVEFVVPASYREALGGLVGRVIEPDGTPVPEMKVEILGGRTTLLAVPRDLRYADAPTDLDLVQGSAVTDAEGRFRITGLEPRTLGLVVVDPAGPRTVVRVLDVVPVTGETHDLGDIVLQAGVTLKGQVVDARGEAIAGARVRATDLEYAYVSLGGLIAAEFQVGGGILVEPPDEIGTVRPLLAVPTASQARLLDRLPIPQQLTDAEGRFEIPGVPVGLATLLVDDGEHLPTAQGPIPTGAAGGERDVGRVILQDGRTLRGRVVDDLGEPVAGASAMVGSDIVGIPVQAAILKPPVLTDADGRFEVRGLRDATVSLAVRGPGVLEPLIMLGEPLPSDELKIVLPGRRRLTVTLKDDNGLSIKGASFFGFALIGNDEQQWDQYVPAYVLPSHRLDGRTTSEEDGVYVIADLDPLMWRITARSDEHALEHARVDLTQASAELDLTLAPAHALEAEVRYAADGAPVEYALVELWDQDVREAPFTSGRTDAQGLVRLSRLEPGTYTLRAVHPALAITSVDVVVPDTDRLTVEMSAGGTIRGQALDRGGPPVEPVLVALNPQGRRRGDAEMPRLTVTDAEGHFRFTNVEPGTVELTALERLPNISGFSFVELFINSPLAKAEVVVPDAGEVDALLLLGSEFDGIETAYLKGRLLVNGRSAEGWKVRCWGEIRRSSVTLADGSFDLGMLAAGDNQITFGPAGGSMGPVEGIEVQKINLEPGENRFLNVSLSTGAVTGRVRSGADGRLMEGVAVRVVPEGEDGNTWITRRETVTLGDGRFEIEPVTKGNYKLRAERDGFATGWSEPFEVRELQTVRGLEVVMQQALKISGTVVLQGVDDPGGWMWLMASSENSERSGATRVNSESGNFEMDNLGPGTYTFRIATGADVEFAPIEVTLERDMDDLLLTFEPGPPPAGNGEVVYELK